MGDTDGTARISAMDFHAAPGVEHWRVLYWGAYAFYRTRSFADGAAFVARIADASAAIGHEPDVDLRPEGVTIRTSTHRDGGLSARDPELAREISRAAGELELAADPSQLQMIGIAVAQHEGVDTRPFWAALTGYEYLRDEDLLDPNRRGPHLWFHRLEPSRPGRGRTHIDVSIPADLAADRVAAALAAGGRMADDSHAPHWWTLASPDNHGVDVAAWADQDTYRGGEQPPAG